MKGFALIEVLVALLLLSLGLLGVAGLQLSALQHSQDAYLQSIADIQTLTLLERLRANKSPTARENELKLWNDLNAKLLPHGIGNYNCQGDFCTVWVEWQTKKQQSVTLSAYL